MTFPLFKGATRAAVFGGVPLIPLVTLVIGVASAAMLFGLWWFAAIVPGWLLMAQLTKADDRAFRILGLWAQTKLVNSVRLVGGKGRFWGASTYALSDGRERSWEGGSRWGG